MEPYAGNQPLSAKGIYSAELMERVGEDLDLF